MSLCTESDYVILVSSLRGTLGNCAMILLTETGLRSTLGHFFIVTLLGNLDGDLRVIFSYIIS